MRKLYFRVIDATGFRYPKNELEVHRDEAKELRELSYSREYWLRWLFGAKAEAFRGIHDYPLTVEVYENPEDTKPLFVGEIREVVSHEFTVHKSK